MEFESVCAFGVVASLLAGRFSIDDRGDGVAEIHLNGDFGEVTAADIAAWSEFDGYLGRQSLPIPVGLKHASLMIGYVDGDADHVHAAQDSKTGEWLHFASGFPGVAKVNGADPARVESIQDLEQYLTENMQAVMLCWLKHTKPPEDGRIN